MNKLLTGPEDIAVTRPSDEYVDTLNLFPKKREKTGETCYSGTINELLKGIGPQQGVQDLDEKLTVEDNIALLLAKKIYYLHNQQIQSKLEAEDNISLAETRIKCVARLYLKSLVEQLQEKLSSLEEAVKPLSSIQGASDQASENLLQNTFATKEDLKGLEERFNRQKGVSLPEVEELLREIITENENFDALAGKLESSLATVSKRLESASELYAPLDEHKQSLHEIEELREQLSSLRLEFEGLAENFDDDWLAYHNLMLEIKKIEVLESENSEINNDLKGIYGDLADIYGDLEYMYENFPEIRDRLGEISSQQSELWQLARRTSREVSEAKAGVWESQEAIKLKQAQDVQSSKLYAQDIAIAEMRKRLDALEAENRSLRQKIKKQEDLRKETEKESEEGVNPGKILLLLIIGLIIIGFLNNS